MDSLKSTILISMKRAFQVMRRHPMRSTVVVSLPLVHWGLKYRAKRQLERPIYNQLVKGTRPEPLTIPRGLSMIKRPHLKKNLHKIIAGPGNEATPKEVDEEFGRFGVVVGPSGTGKPYW